MFCAVALMRGIGNVLTGGDNQKVGGVEDSSFHLYDTSGNDFFTPIPLASRSSRTIPENGVLFELGNHQVDKIEWDANGDLIVYTSLSSRIPRGVYTWTTSEEVITEVRQNGDTWEASGSLLTVTAEIYGDHWT